MKIEVNREGCLGYGVCAEDAPEIFGLDDDGFVVLSREDVPEDLLPGVREAVRNCPTGVLKLDEGGS